MERRNGATALAGEERISDGFAVLTPANDVVAHGIMHGLGQGGHASRAPLYYVHQGLGSKTSRMADFLPYRLEGEFTYQEILDAHRWVTTREFNLPIALQGAIREDMIDSIVYAIRHDDEAAEILLNALPGRRLSPMSDRLPGRIRENLRLPNLPASFPRTFRHVVPVLDETQAFLEVQSEMKLLLERSARGRTRR